MKKVIAKTKPLTRQCLADPYFDKKHSERLVESKAIDLKNNHTIEVLRNGYWKIKPIDTKKVFK